MAMADAQIPARTISPPLDGDSDHVKVKIEQDHNSKPALTPPTSESTKDNHDDSGSELSDLEPEDAPKPEPVEDIKMEEAEEILPDHYWDDGKIPVFRPTMRQFRSFKEFINKIDKYGMKSGIVKVIPPQEWRDSLPALDEAVKKIRVKNPITQEFHGTHGTYTQANMEKQRSYNLPQWRSLCEESNHQPPAKRGERRRNLEKPAQMRMHRSKAERAETPKKDSSPTSEENNKRTSGRSRAKPVSTAKKVEEAAETRNEKSQSPAPNKTSKGKPAKTDKKTKATEKSTKGRQPKSVTSRRLNNQRDQVDYVDEEAFKEFDYRVYDQNEWTKERIQELETAYWRSLNFNNPMYGADMPGSLFDESTQEWNVAKLENLLDVLGQAVPGVNTAYLYLGMWKASFAWHLEDVDLYSINYIHFGAPKQWYSISQEDARRFESAMKTIWPTDSKNCDQFLRHKTYLISPHLLQSQFNIKVNRLVHFEGEFVITFPYGYHSGFNIGYNCAESVNFATESWLDYGKVARKCNCEADNVWVDVRQIERRLRGEPTPEYYEETDEDEEDEDDEGENGQAATRGTIKGKAKKTPKRKRPANDKDAKPKVKKLKIRVKAPAFEPCILCPNDDRFQELLPTDNGQRAHRICGLYTPETYVSTEPDGNSVIRDIAFIDKARWDLKCNYCRSRKGSVFQCSSKKCTKAYHATCAMAAGIQIDIGPTPVYGEDGTEYIDTGYDFRCRIHRSKRSKNADSWNLEANDFILSRAKKLSKGDTVQAQFYQGDIFAGNVLESRKDEQNVLLEILPKGETVEVEWKWLLFFDPVNSQLPVPSENAKPLPADMLRKSRTTAEDPAAKVEDAPKPNDPFYDPRAVQKWSEFSSCRPIVNKHQEKVDLSKDDQLWHFIGEISTDAKQYFTHDPAIRTHNQKSNFLDIEKAKQLAESLKKMNQQKTFVAAPGAINQHAINAARANNPNAQLHAKHAPQIKERPYNGKYAITDPVPRPPARQPYGYNVDQQSLQMQRAFQQHSIDMQRNRPNYYPYDQYNSAHGYAPSNGQAGSSAPNAAMPPPTPSPAPPPYLTANADFTFNATALLRKIGMASSIPPLPPAPQYSKPPSLSAAQHTAQAPAPVANMLGGVHPKPVQQSIEQENPPAGPAPNPAAESQSAQPGEFTMPPSPQSPSVSIISIGHQPAKGESHLDLDPKYRYLHDAEKARPLKYQSPYAHEGGFTEAYLPDPALEHKRRPRGPSISEAYLMARSPSEQGKVNAQVTEDKAKFIESQKKVQRRPHSMSGPQMLDGQKPGLHSHRPHSYQPSHLPMSAFQNPSPNHSHPTSPSYYTTQAPSNPAAYGQYATAYPSPPYRGSGHQPPNQYNQHHLHYSRPVSSYPSFPVKPPSLNFQSPQDFREQMQKEAQRPSSHDGGFERFSQQLKDAGTAPNRPATSDQWYGGGDSRNNSSGAGVFNNGYGGSAGSPLRHEFGKGDDMLPMMRDEGGLSVSR